MRVLPHAGQGYVMVAADHRDDTYIDARPSTTSPGFSRISFVRCGRRVFRELVPIMRAPARIIEIARGERL